MTLADAIRAQLAALPPVSVISAGLTKPIDIDHENSVVHLHEVWSKREEITRLCVTLIDHIPEILEALTREEKADLEVRRAALLAAAEWFSIRGTAYWEGQFINELRRMAEELEGR